MTRWDSLTTLTLKNNHSRGVKRDKLVKRASEQRSRNQKVQGRLEVGSVRGTQESQEVALGGVIPASGTGYCHPRSGHGQDHAVGCSHHGHTTPPLSSPGRGVSFGFQNAGGRDGDTRHRQPCPRPRVGWEGRNQSLRA